MISIIYIINILNNIMKKVVYVSDETHKELSLLKINLDMENLEEVIKMLLQRTDND